MKKTTIYLDDADDVLLTQAAERRGASRTDMIREAIRKLLGTETVPHKPRAPLGNSGRTDIARRMDEYLDEGFGQQ